MEFNDYLIYACHISSQHACVKYCMAPNADWFDKIIIAKSNFSIKCFCPVFKMNILPCLKGKSLLVNESEKIIYLVIRCTARTSVWGDQASTSVRVGEGGLKNQKQRL
ncbi:hypothetical protein OTU49_008624 [Cherax quadricarinatus]|uniref:Uncharacterized protein n=1 Tax=Cherax quadricarinatus TaxID=27406 RepID=A0AAW0WNQ9_CHEQU